MPLTTLDVALTHYYMHSMYDITLAHNSPGCELHDMIPPSLLQLRNRLNAAQNTKLENHKEMLSSKQQLLAEKQRELEQLKRKQLLATKQGHVTLSGRHVTPPKSTPHKEPFPPAGSTPPTISPDHRTPSSTSKKRHSSIFEARHRQLREEEGLTFRESQARLHGDKKEGMYTCC